MTRPSEPVPEAAGSMTPGDEVPAGTPQSGEAICPDCVGTGKRRDGKRCTTCEGTGTVTQLVGDA